MRWKHLLRLYLSTQTHNILFRIGQNGSGLTSEILDVALGMNFCAQLHLQRHTNTFLPWAFGCVCFERESLSANNAAHCRRARKAIIFPGTLGLNPAILWGRELIAPSAARRARLCVVPSTLDVQGCLSRAGTSRLSLQI